MLGDSELVFLWLESQPQRKSHCLSSQPLSGLLVPFTCPPHLPPGGFTLLGQWLLLSALCGDPNPTCDAELPAWIAELKVSGGAQRRPWPALPLSLPPWLPWVSGWQPGLGSAFRCPCPRFGPNLLPDHLAHKRAADLKLVPFSPGLWWEVPRSHKQGWSGTSQHLIIKWWPLIQLYYVSRYFIYICCCNIPARYNLSADEKKWVPEAKDNLLRVTKHPNDGPE